MRLLGRKRARSPAPEQDGKRGGAGNGILGGVAHTVAQLTAASGHCLMGRMPLGALVTTVRLCMAETLALPRPTLLDDLPAELLALVAGALSPDDELAASLCSRKLHDAVATARAREARTGSTTDASSALASVRKLLWALTCGLPLEPSLCALAAARGQFAELTRLRRNGSPWDARTCERAAGGGYLWMLWWARVSSPDTRMCSAAAFGSYMGMLHYVCAHGCPWDTRAFIFAALGVHQAMLQWLRADRGPMDTINCSGAALTIYLASYDDDRPLGTLLYRSVTALGFHLSIMKLVCADGCPWDTRTCSAAALGGHLFVLRWAREDGCPWDAWTCVCAALGGHMSVLQWASALGCPWDTRVCSAAALGGHLAVLLWARSNGCPWDALTCRAAVRGVHMASLQWARANGCPWGSLTCASARVLVEAETLGEDDPLYELACAHGRDGKIKQTAARQAGVEAAVVWLRENGCPEH
jgi:hypothetical protein